MNIRKIDDYYDLVQEKFSEVPKSDIKKILNYGMRVFYLRNLYGADVLLKSKYFTLYSGRFFSSNLVFYHYWRLKYKIKLRIKYKQKRIKYNGQYYFGMTDNEYDEYKNQFKSKGRKRQKVLLKHVYAYKILDECLLDKAKRHFFILYYDTDLGFTIYKDKYETRNIKYICKRNKNNEIELI